MTKEEFAKNFWGEYTKALNGWMCTTYRALVNPPQTTGGILHLFTQENEMKLYEVVIWTLDANGERSDEFTYHRVAAESAKDAEHAVLFDMKIREANTVDVEVREFHPLA